MCILFEELNGLFCGEFCTSKRKQRQVERTIIYQNGESVSKKPSRIVVSALDECQSNLKIIANVTRSINNVQNANSVFLLPIYLECMVFLTR